MHEAAAAVAGGSIGAMEAILGGDVEHAFHPGGGLHHAMPERASGFCIYDDPALAIARARQNGLRVLYVDLDVHHGDGVQAIHWADPGVLTLSFHETGRYLFPGTGGLGELGEGVAAGTAVNVPLEPGTGEGPWLAAVRALLPELAAAFGPDVIVSQHGADSHAWDPLAHLRVTTTAMGAAARLVDLVAHRYAGGRWLATGGGGYDVYRVVPRSWSLVWLAGAHREVPAAIPPAWRERWAGEALRYGQAPLPELVRRRAERRRAGRCRAGRGRGTLGGDRGPCPTRRRSAAAARGPRSGMVGPARRARRRDRHRGRDARRNVDRDRHPVDRPRGLGSADARRWRRRAGRPSRRARPDRRRPGRWAPGDGGRRGHDGGRRGRLAGGGRPGTGGAARARRGAGTATPGPRHQSARDARRRRPGRMGPGSPPR